MDIQIGIMDIPHFAYTFMDINYSIVDIYNKHIHEYILRKPVAHNFSPTIRPFNIKASCYIYKNTSA